MTSPVKNVVSMDGSKDLRVLGLIHMMFRTSEDSDLKLDNPVRSIAPHDDNASGSMVMESLTIGIFANAESFKADVAALMLNELVLKSIDKRRRQTRSDTSARTCLQDRRRLIPFTTVFGFPGMRKFHL